MWSFRGIILEGKGRWFLPFTSPLCYLEDTLCSPAPSGILTLNKESPEFNQGTWWIFWSLHPSEPTCSKIFPLKWEKNLPALKPLLFGILWLHIQKIYVAVNRFISCAQFLIYPCLRIRIYIGSICRTHFIYTKNIGSPQYTYILECLFLCLCLLQRDTRHKGSTV